MTTTEIVIICAILFLCAIISGAMWVQTWGTDEKHRKANEDEILRTILKEMRGEDE